MKFSGFANFICPLRPRNRGGMALPRGRRVSHQVGACNMGADPMAVVNADLSVHGLSGLRVADASVMPTLISGNTNAATIMIGEKAADILRRSEGNRAPPS